MSAKPGKNKAIRFAKRIAAATCGALVGVYAVALHREPKIIPPVRPAMPPVNGFPLLRDAAAQVVHSKEITEAAAQKPDKKWTLPEKRALVIANHAALEQAHEALRYPYLEPVSENTFSGETPYYRQYREMNRVFFLAGNVAWEDGDRNAAINYYLDGITMGRRIPHHTGLIGSLVGIGTEKMARRGLWQHRNQMDERTATNVLARLEALRSERLPYAETIREEKYIVLTGTKTAMEHPRKFLEIAGTGGYADTIITVYGRVVPREYVIRTMTTQMDKLIAQTEHPYISDHQELPLPSEIYTRIMLPVFVRARCKYVASIAGDSLLRTALALRIFRLRHGAYPAHLADLVTAKIIDAVPDDPFALPGTPLQYTVRPDGFTASALTASTMAVKESTAASIIARGARCNSTARVTSLRIGTTTKHDKKGRSQQMVYSSVRVFNRVCIAACVAVIGVYFAALVAPPAQIDTPKRFPQPERNGFTLLKAATEKPRHEKDIIDAVLKAPKNKWTLEAKRALVAENGVAIQKTQEALSIPYYQENDVVSFRTMLPYYKNFRVMARVLTLAGDVAWADGKQQEAVDYYLQSVTMGRRIPHRTLYIGRLVGIACEAPGRAHLWRHLDEMNAETATYTLARLEALDRERVPLWENLEEEKFSTLRATQEILEHPRSVNFLSDEVIDSSSPIEWQQDIYCHLVPHKYVLDTIGNFMDTAIAQSKRSYIEDHAPVSLPKEILAHEVLPIIEKGRCKSVANDAADALLRTALALRVYRLQTGSYPENLSDLVAARVLVGLDDDPFALPGTALKYERQSGDKYLLYSIGPDGVDDNGRGTTIGKPSDPVDRAIVIRSKGDMVAGWYDY